MFGPHGSKLADVIIAGSSATVIELISHDLFSSWYAQQCVHQSSSWLSYPGEFDLVRLIPTANASAIVKVLSVILLDRPYYKPTSKYQFLDVHQI